MQTKVDFREAVNRKFPEQVAIAIAKDSKGKSNPITLGWMMWTSISPPMLAISLGESRYTLEIVRQSKEFVVALPSTTQRDEALFYGTRSGRTVDKLKEFGAKTQPCETIDCVLLSDAVANFECRKVGELRSGDHFIVVGEVVASHANEEKKAQRLFSIASGHTLGSVSVTEIRG